jgi:hypothetical protein
MTLGGWVFLVVGWGVILAAFVYSMARTLRPKS